MFRLLKSKSGAVIVFGLVLAGLALAALPFMTPRFRRQKAMEMCIETNTPLWDCERIVAEMDPAGLLSYIKDR